MATNPKKTRAFIITFIVVLILLVLGYFLFVNKNNPFGNGVSKMFGSLITTLKQKGFLPLREGEVLPGTTAGETAGGALTTTLGDGTISTSEGSDLVKGNSTTFSKYLGLGSIIIGNGESHIVTSIASDTSITTDRWNSSFNGAYSLTNSTGTLEAGSISVGKGGGTVTGTGTQFDIDFNIGDTIIAGGEMHIITAILSPTSLTTDPWTNSFFGTYGKLTGTGGGIGSTGGVTGGTGITGGGIGGTGGTGTVGEITGGGTSGTGSTGGVGTGTGPGGFTSFVLPSLNPLPTPGGFGVGTVGTGGTGGVGIGTGGGTGIGGSGPAANAPAPYIKLSSNPTILPPQGGPVKISVITDNVKSCSGTWSATANWFGKTSFTTASISVTGINNTFMVICDSTKGGIFATLTIPLTGPNPALKATLTATPTSINTGTGQTNLAWTSASATSCTKSWVAGTAAKVGTSGSETLTISKTETFTITCTDGVNAASNSKTVIVSSTGVTAPRVTITATPSAVSNIGGGAVTLTYDVYNYVDVPVCVGDWKTEPLSWTTGTGFAGEKHLRNTDVQTVTADKTFKISCTDTAASATATKNFSAQTTVKAINLNPNFAITMTATPNYINNRTGGSSILAWNYIDSINPVCTMSWNPNLTAADRSATVTVTKTTNFGITCTDGSNVRKASIPVTVVTFPIVQCSDGVDNDSDGFIDAADAGCHSDIDAKNAASYDPNGFNEANENGRTIVVPKEKGKQCTNSTAILNDADQAKLNKLIRDFYRLAPNLATKEDVLLETQNYTRYTDTIAKAKTYTTQCYAERAANGPSAGAIAQYKTAGGYLLEARPGSPLFIGTDPSPSPTFFQGLHGDFNIFKIKRLDPSDDLRNYLFKKNATISTSSTNTSTTGHGTISTIIGSAIVTGAGTQFDVYLGVGDTITAGGETHTITAMSSPTRLLTDNGWSQSLSNNVYSYVNKSSKVITTTGDDIGMSIVVKYADWDLSGMAITGHVLELLKEAGVTKYYLPDTLPIGDPNHVTYTDSKKGEMKNLFKQILYTEVQQYLKTLAPSRDAWGTGDSTIRGDQFRNWRNWGGSKHVHDQSLIDLHNGDPAKWGDWHASGDNRMDEMLEQFIDSGQTDETRRALFIVQPNPDDGIRQVREDEYRSTLVPKYQNFEEAFEIW